MKPKVLESEVSSMRKLAERMMFFLHSKIADSKYPWVVFHLMGCVVLFLSALKHHRRGSHFLERRHIIGSMKQLMWAALAVGRC